MKTICIAAAIFILPGSLFAQAYCRAILDEANRQYQAQEYDETFRSLQDLENCDLQDVLIKERQLLLNQLLTAIKGQRDREKVLKEKALQSQKDAVESAAQAFHAEKLALKAFSKADSLKINQYNISRALALAQENPTLAWNVVKRLTPSKESGYYAKLTDVVYELASDERNGVFKKTLKFGHDPLLAMAWTGDTLLTAHRSGKIRHWSAEGILWDSTVFAPAEVSEKCRATFTPNGRTFVISEGKNIALWDVRGKRKTGNQTLPATAGALACSNDGRYIVAVVGADILAYDENLELVDDFQLGYTPLALAVANDGYMMVSASQSGQTTRFFKIGKGRKIKKINAKISSANMLAGCFGDDPAFFLAATDKSQALYGRIDADSAEYLTGHNKTQAVTIASAGRYLATGGQDKMVRIWLPERGNYRQIAILKGHEQGVTRLAFSSDSRFIASACAGSMVKIWFVNSKRKSLIPSQRQLSALAMIDSAGSWVLAGDRGGGIFATSFDGDGKGVWRQETKVTALAFMPLTTRFVSGGADGRLYVWDRKQSAVADYRSAPGTDGAIRSIAVSSRSDELVSGHQNGIVRVWETGNYTSETLGQKHPCPIVKVAYARDYIVVIDSLGAIQLYNKRSRELEKTLGPHGSEVNAAAVSFNGKYLLTASRQEVKLWDLQNIRHSFVLPAVHANDVSGVAFAADRYLLSVGWDGAVLVWTLEGKLLYKVSEEYSKSINLLAATNDGRYFVTADSALAVWRMPATLVEEAAELLDAEHLIRAGILLDSLAYKNIADPALLRQTAEIYKKLGSPFKTQTLYATAVQALQKKHKAGVITDEEKTLLRDIRLAQCESSPQNGASDPFQKLIQETVDPEDLETYADYFYEQERWDLLRKTCEKYRSAAQKTESWYYKYLLTTQIETGNFKEVPAEVGAYGRADLEELARFFRNCGDGLAETGPKQIHYLRAASQLSLKLFQKQKTAYLREYLLGCLNNLGWYQILNAEPVAAKKTIEDAWAFIVSDNKNQPQINENPDNRNILTSKISDRTAKLLRMNYAHALLLSGDVANAKIIYLDLRTQFFVDKRHLRFSNAFLEDLNEIEAIDKKSKKEIVRKNVAAAFKEVKNLMEQP